MSVFDSEAGWGKRCFVFYLGTDDEFGMNSV